MSRGLDFSQQAVIAALQAHRIDRRLNVKDWKMSADVAHMLMLNEPPPEVEGLDEWLDRALESFMRFERTFFRTNRGPYVRKPFHWRWIRATLKAIVTGGQVCITAPPRHGKTDLLIHFCLWLICRDPDVRILWIGSNADDLATAAVSAVRDHLESNMALRKAVLPPDRSFAPIGRRSANWSSKKITVACRQAIGSKAPTMMGIGEGSAVLSKDADFIVVDDIENFKNTQSESERTGRRTWFYSDVGSRKEEHTAWLYICSRQHHDDLAGHLVEDPEWEVLVESAHEATCPLDPEDLPIHQDCMLFPEIRTYRWLRGKYRGAIALGLEDHYEMVYLGVTRPAGAVFWTRELCAQAYNDQRGLGLADFLNDPKDLSSCRLKLIAGLDPSATRHQAGFLWGCDLSTRRSEDGAKMFSNYREYMIDLDDRVGGGVGPFLELGEEWRVKYGLRHWVIEITMYRTGFINDEKVLAWSNRHGIILEPHDTQGRNSATTVAKMDPFFGVGAMRHKYDPPPIVDLPTGTSEARIKVEKYVTEALRFTDNATVLKRRDTNILMASWFPQRTMRRWRSEVEASIAPQPEAWDESFSGFDLSDYSTEPW